ncbi:PQQ-like beta-propeller repeat protein [Candidatus Woesearchaeota archaeon]|nr:PQQ-like beta-propeller repeat protein [Candidatus Woesearchaeota archaeon]
MAKIAFGIPGLVRKKEGGLVSPWSFDTKSSLLSSPLVTDIDQDNNLEVVFGTKGGKIFCLDTYGKMKWEYSIVEKVDPVEAMFLDAESSNSIESSPAIIDLNGDGKKEIIFGSALGILYAISSTGKLLFKYEAKGPIKGAVHVADITGDGKPEIIFGSSDKKIYVLNNQGKLLWRKTFESEVESSPAYILEHKLIVFGDNEGFVIALNQKGEEQWRYKTGGKVIAKPIAGKLGEGEETTIIIGSTDYCIYALSVQGELLWKYGTEGAICSEACIEDINKDGYKEILIGSCDNSVYALNHQGDRLWSYETNFWVVAKPIAADIDDDGNIEIVVGSYDHNIYILDSEGTYLIDHIPGISGVVHQAGHYSDVPTSESGQHRGKRIWQYKTDGIIVGCAYAEDLKHLVVSTKVGKINTIKHTKGER